MKKFENAEIVELNIANTALEPTVEKETDLFVEGTDGQPGYFVQGTDSGSRESNSVPYWPN